MRDLVATTFEVISLLGLAVAAGLYLWRFDPALGVACGSGVLLVEGLVLAVLEPSTPTGDDA